MLRWLHLSDLHFNFSGYETDWLRDQLFFKLEEFKGSIDFLVVTGDLLFKFGSTFDGVEVFLTKLIQSLNISKDNVFIVPGNHDFKRNPMRETFISGLKNPINGTKTKVSQLDESFKNLLINDGQKEFWEFHERLLGRKSNLENIHFVDARDKFNIINLNTCVISGTNGEEGTLSISLSNLMKALKSIEDTDKPIIAIGHHSLDCFIESEVNEIAQIFDQYHVDMYLCGHMHNSGFEINNVGTRECRSFVCGYNMTDGYAEPAFVLGNIDLDTNECRVKFYKWSEKGKKWIPNLEVDSKVDDDGFIKFTLDRLKKKENLNKSITKDELFDKRVEQILQGDIKEEKFQKFLLSFCENIKSYEGSDSDVTVNKDVPEKFKNMKCNSTFRNEFDLNVEYFNLIDNILSGTSYIYYDRKTLIPGVIRTKYAQVYESCENGTQVLNKMIDELAHDYMGVIDIPFRDLKEYFKTIVFWSLNKCDIYNECI